MNFPRMVMETDDGCEVRVNDQDIEFYKLIIHKVVSTIFEKYDLSKTHQGKLSRKNARYFIQDTLGNFSTGEDVSENLVHQIF